MLSDAEIKAMPATVCWWWSGREKYPRRVIDPIILKEEGTGECMFREVYSGKYYKSRPEGITAEEASKPENLIDIGAPKPIIDPDTGGIVYPIAEKVKGGAAGLVVLVFVFIAILWYFIFGGQKQ